jgi:hypothetical protein
MAVYRRRKSDRVQPTIYGLLVLVIAGGFVAIWGALTWPTISWVIVGWAILSLDLTERPGWVSRQGEGLAGLTALPRLASQDLFQAGYPPLEMALGLWASTLSRNLDALRFGLVATGLAASLVRILTEARTGTPSFPAWVWLIPLFYFSQRLILNALSPERTLRSSISTLETARIAWRRRHDPMGFLGQAVLTLARYSAMLLVFLAAAAFSGFLFVGLHRDLPFDPQDSANLYWGAAAALVLGATVGWMMTGALRLQKERLLRRMANLLAWLLEVERALATGETPRTFSAVRSGMRVEPRSRS